MPWINRHQFLFSFVVTSLLCTWPVWGFAQDLVQIPTTTLTPTASSPNITDQLNFLGEQASSLREAAAAERAAYVDFVKFTVGMMWAILTVAGFMLAFFIGKKFKDIGETLDRLVDKYIKRHLSRLNKQKIDPLIERVNDELSYKKKSIVFIVPEGESQIVKTEESLLRRHFAVAISSEIDAVQDADLVLYLYTPNPNRKEDGSLRSLVDLLKQGRNKPLIIYTYNRGNGNQLTDTDFDFLQEHYAHYYVLANFPATLINSTFTTLKVYT